MKNLFIYKGTKKIKKTKTFAYIYYFQRIFFALNFVALFVINIVLINEYQYISILQSAIYIC